MRDINDVPEAVVELLDQSRCQDVLCYLRQQERPVSFDELTRRIANWESDRSRSDVSDVHFEEISRSLRQDYLPPLIELGLLERHRNYEEEYLTITEKVETIESDLRPRAELGPTEYRVE